jgi:hypothetical protein
MDEGGVACVSERVRDRLLGQAVERGVDRRRQLVEVTGQCDVDMGRVPSVPGEPLDVGDAGLGGEVGLLAPAKGADDGSHLGQRMRRLLLDDDEGVEDSLGTRLGDGATGLGLDGDGRHMVSDGVVQLARQLLALAELGLVPPVQPGAAPVPERRAESRGEQEDQSSAHHLAHGGAGGANHDREQHERQSDRGLATRAPSEQRVGKQQEDQGRGFRPLPRHANHDCCELDGGEQRECNCDHRERVRAPPEQHGSHGDDQDEVDGSPHHILSGDRLDRPNRQHRGDEHPVPPQPFRRVGNPGLGP